MQFPDASGKRVNLMYPVDNTYWTKLKTFVDYERVSAIDPELRGVLGLHRHHQGTTLPADREATGIQELLKKSVETAPKMILAFRQLGRPDGRNRYYKDRQYENTWAGGTAEWMQDGYLDVYQRAAYFQVAFSSASAMVMRTLDAGSKYPFTTRDAQGEFLNGSNTTNCTCRQTHLRHSSGPSQPTTSSMALCRKHRNCCPRSTASTMS